MPARGWEQCAVMWLGVPCSGPVGFEPMGCPVLGTQRRAQVGGGPCTSPHRALSFSTAVWQPPCSGQASTGTSRESQGVLAMMHKPSHIFLLPPKTREQKGTPPLPMDNRAGKGD